MIVKAKQVLDNVSTENGATSSNIHEIIMHNKSDDSSVTTRAMYANNAIC